MLETILKIGRQYPSHPVGTVPGGTLKNSVADPHNFDAVPDPDPGFQIKAQNLEKRSNRLISLGGTFWFVICNLMRIRIQLITLMRIRIQLITLMWIRIPIKVKGRIYNTA
jgi:hypothetical protein